ncbi:MAG: hypothetical protein J6T32_02465 [Paludibacteraceae bacterium]|nr:hypothetical protein [Paludibacteraceae bacterium]
MKQKIILLLFGISVVIPLMGQAKKTLSLYQSCDKNTIVKTANGGTYRGYGFVDLGLSVMWATTNVGASSEEEAGGYYCWATSYTQSNYNAENYKYYYYQSSTKIYTTKYITYLEASNAWAVDNLTTVEPVDDAAFKSWGGNWRMPTAAEAQELLNNCTLTWETVNGVNGCRFTSNVAGYTDRSIFLPAAKYKYGTSLGYWEYGYYWTSSLTTGNTNNSNAKKLYFNNTPTGSVSNQSRTDGLPIRPVFAF